MSGTSLDGLDLCLSHFWKNGDRWDYKIIAAETLAYEAEWKEKLKSCETCAGEDLLQMHFSYGSYLGTLAHRFLERHGENADFISSHGHTIFHQVEKGFTFQLGHGAAIAASTGLACVSDFRSMDVALKGQGAPLVPFGEKFLFPEYSCCLNIGGIANISYRNNNQLLAFDIAPANQVLNSLYQSAYSGEYDVNGATSKKGQLNESLFKQLNQLDFYQLPTPKSLGREWVESKVIPLLKQHTIPVEDKLHTFTRHLAYQIEVQLANITPEKVLVSGGGAYNSFLISCLKEGGRAIVIPEQEVIEFKEALIFAFLGLMRHLELENTYSSVTGALRDSIGGCIFKV
jgi:anhydro-N-acetylmuramic acid kinase